MLAATVELEEAGGQAYLDDHMGKIFTEGFSFSGFERDKLYLGDGSAFVDISGLSGLDSVTDGRGAAYGDYDNDGDYDVFLTALQGQVHLLFRNNVGQQQGFIRVALEGVASGRDAYGAVVRVETSQGTQTQIKAGGSGFVSQSDPRLLFGLGQDAAAKRMEVRWPSGAVQRFGPVAAGASVKIVEGRDELVYVEDERRFTLPEPARPGEQALGSLRIRVGDRFPALRLVDAETGEAGQTFDDLRQPGRRYLVNFWATWCGPCRAEMPHLQRLYPELKAAGVDIVGLSLDLGAARQRVSTFLSRLGITYPVAIVHESDFGQIYAGDQLVVPVSFVVGANGRIEQILSGWSPETEAAIHRLLVP